jgi:hypothetical protein
LRGSRFGVQGSAQLQTANAVSLIENEILELRESDESVQVQGEWLVTSGL